MRLLPRRKGAAADNASGGGVTRSPSHLGRSRQHHSANPYDDDVDDDDTHNEYDRRCDWEVHGHGAGGFAPSKSFTRQYGETVVVAPIRGGGAAVGDYHDDISYGSHPNNVSFSASNKKQQPTPGNILRKLNCIASKRDAKEQLQQEYEIEAVHQPPSSSSNSWQKRSSWGVSIPQLRRSKSQSDITRPVLITVKDGDFSSRHGPSSHSQYDDYHHHYDSDRRKAEDQFVVGKLPRNHPSRSSSIPFRLGISVRNHQQGADRSPKIKSERPMRNDLASASNSPLRRFRSSSTRDMVHDTSVSNEHQDFNRNRIEEQDDGRPTTDRDMRNVRTAEEIARKERWRRGLELERKMWQDKSSTTSCALGGVGDGGDVGDADSLADGSHTTGTGTRDHHSRGEYSRSSAGYTTDQTDTDDSDEYDHQGRYNGVRVLSKSFHNNQRMFQGVAEDLGIVARMILADGTACMGTAAAITSETVAGCKSG